METAKIKFVACSITGKVSMAYIALSILGSVEGKQIQIDNAYSDVGDDIYENAV